MTQLFISDLHLDESRPEALDAFITLLRGEAREAERLYILGDLFETWIGDDIPGPAGKRVIDELQSLHRSGTACYFIRGNRDFLIRSRFATAAGVHLLPDYALTTINGERVLLMHGDLLCTDDIDYLRYRKVVHNSAVQALFLSLPKSFRNNIADKLRAKSQTDNSIKQPEILDVAQTTVELVMQCYETRILVHGHTHRPAVHDMTIDGEPATRIVLGDWYEQGSILRWDDSGYALDSLTFDAQ